MPPPSVVLKHKKLIALAVVILCLLLAVSFRPAKRPPPSIPKIKLEEDYIVLAEVPKTSTERAFVAALSSLIVRDKYHPFFIIEDGKLDEHQLWTIEHMSIGNAKKLLFTNSNTTASLIKDQLSSVDVYPIENHTLAQFMGFNGTISVGSYEEALWVAPLARIENKAIILGKSTFSSQEDVWRVLKKRHNLSASYVVVTNPMDYMPRGTATTRSTDAILRGEFDKWHVPHLSLLAAELAAYHKAYVLTDAVPCSTPLGDYDGELNSYCTGLLLALRNLSAVYGPVEYICLVGSGSSVPQFEVADYTNPDDEDRTVSSDIMYGFLDEDMYTMDAAVGRIINYNIAGASNMVARILGCDYIAQEITVVSKEGNTRENYRWITHGSAWNGYQVADIRRQLTPGYFFTRDLEDEGFTYEYITTRGVGRDRANHDLTLDLELILQSSGIVAYRGHGSPTGSFYMWGQGIINDDSLTAEEARELFLPPQVFVSCSCSNGHIWGIDFGEENDLDKTFSVSYLYGGGVALIASTEVSYSNSGQDKYAIAGEVTGDHKWDCNNAIYAFTVDGLLNHEEEHGTVGKALQWTENRYIKNHDFTVSPFYAQGDAVHWKEVTMFALYGDPAFVPYQERPGPNGYDPWHNGDDDY